MAPAKKRQSLPDIELKGARLAFSKRTYVMGVLNVTPDSFSDGGKFLDEKKAVERGLAMAAEGADIIDVGGESTRPGAGDVSVDEELSRAIPVIKALSGRTGLPISVDTRKSEVAEEAMKAGAAIVNDVSGLRFDSGMAAVISKYGAACILTHSLGTPMTMQVDPKYKNLIGDIISGLRESITMAKAAGIREENIIVDPGIGFGKTVEHNLEILRRLDELEALSRPVCVGTSRKSFIGKVLGIENPDDRLSGSIATSCAAIMRGACLIRTHDVKEMVMACRITDRIMRG